MTTKRRFSVSVIVAAITTVGVGFGTATGSGATQAAAHRSGSPETITLAVTNFRATDGLNPVTGRMAQGFQTLVQPFLQQHPNVQIKLIQVAANSSTATMAKWDTLLLSHQVDIIQGVTMWPFYQQGLLADLTPYVTKDNWRSHFVSGVYAAPSERFYFPPWTTHPKTIIAVPADLDTLSLAYDKKIFQDYGLTPLSTHPTIEEVVRDAQKLTGKDPRTGQKTYGLWYDPRGQSHVLLYYFGHGINFGRLDPKHPAEIAFDTPQIKSDIKQILSISAYAPPGFQIGQGDENWGATTNNVAIRLDVGPQDMYVATQNHLQNRFIVTQGITNRQGHGMFVSGFTYTVAKSSTHKATDWELLKYLSGPAGQKFLYENYGLLPSWTNQNWVDNAKDPYASAFVATAQHAQNAFFPEFVFTTFRPWMATIIADAVSNQSYNLDAGLAQMQKQAEEWAKEQTYTSG